MTTTMMYTTGASMDEPKNSFATKTSSGKPRHRPKSLQIEPFDPSELSKKLTGLAVEQDSPSSQSTQSPQSLQAPLSGNSMDLLSPRTALPPKQMPPTTTTAVKAKPHKEKKEDKSRAPAPGAPPPRRGSIFDHLRFRGSNYTDETQKQEEDDAKKPVRYRHVPQVAAAQFARTTTVEPLAQKSPPITKQMGRPVPGPHSMNNGTISLQEYNKQYRRTQSMCNGRPVVSPGFSKLASTAELDEEPPKPKKKNNRLSTSSQFFSENSRAGGNTGRRMSTGNMWGKPDPQTNPFRRDSTGVGGFNQQNTQNASSIRRGSASSSGFSDVSSPFARDSGPTSPFKQEFGASNSPLRRGSETAPPSRRGSMASMANPQHTAEIHRVDWSQSDQPVKVRRDSKWAGLKNRKPSMTQLKPSNEKEGPIEVETRPSTSPKSPKGGLLKRFKY
ncbi:hypothetical protein FZEAL_201 [Fusarium zealandicum]|uniref:Uncharacterized protein n=1 Tax=Fusarium zealandicum TaxID=1053134 RepID=A0A8H4XPZ0_9HYPO|nr:hypothetical protein FZEAL_201 [Fusarium zealandicum]